jgi:hypothetical protein
MSMICPVRTVKRREHAVVTAAFSGARLGVRRNAEPGARWLP